MLTFLRSRKRTGLVCIVFCLASLCKEANTLCSVLQVSKKKPTYCQLLTSFRISNRMFVDAILWNVFLDLIFYGMKLMCCPDHLNSLLLIFCSFSFTLSIVPTVSFCSYLILISKRIQLIHKFAVFKG